MATRTNNSGILGKNDRKETENHADLRGDALVDGTRYWVSAWLKQSEKGPFYSLSFREVEEAQPSTPKPDEELFF